MSIKRILEKHRENWVSDDFPDWKITEIMYCKLSWVIDALDGSDDLSEHLDIVIELQSFIEDLQKLEKK